MSVLVVGLSYRTAPLPLLERSALSAAQCRELERDLVRGDHVAEAVVLSTCNRLEVYAEVDRFHGGVGDVGSALAGATGVALPDLTDHLYVHYEEAAVAHLFSVASGLDSMAVGEQQILGQVRVALRAAQDGGSLGSTLGGLLQHALRVGKRVHTETGLDAAGRSLVEAGLERAGHVVGPLGSARVLVVGAGVMSGLAVATIARAGAGSVRVANRTFERAQRLAASVGGAAVGIEDLDAALADADVVVSCTGAAGQVVGAGAVAGAMAARGGRPQVYVDLALPRDVDPAVEQLDGVTVLDLAALGALLAGDSTGADLADAREIVAAEVEAYLTARRAQAVAPTVTALRAHARRLVEAELARFESRLGRDVDERTVRELELTVHRVVEKLLYTPTVRVKELAGEPGGSAYADALRALFDLDFDAAGAITGPALAGPALAGPALAGPALGGPALTRRPAAARSGVPGAADDRGEVA